MAELRVEAGRGEERLISSPGLREADVQDRPLLLDDEQLLSLSAEATLPRAVQRWRGSFVAAVALATTVLAFAALRFAWASPVEPRQSDMGALSMKAQPLLGAHQQAVPAHSETSASSASSSESQYGQCKLVGRESAEGTADQASEKDLDYVMDGDWADHLDGIPNAELCCKQCEDSPVCTAWTWVKDAKLRGGVPSQCWLKGGELIRRKPKNGVVSGALKKSSPPPPPSKRGVTLYCWSVMRMTGYEKSLIRDQMAHGASIFACDGYSVFSPNRTWLTKGPPALIESEVLPTDLNLAMGGATTASWVNTESFFRAWEKIRVDQRYQQFDWVVKVDPDCVFFPHRLKEHLSPVTPHKGRPDPLYVLNCAIKAADGFGMYGSIETVSSTAVDVYLKGLARCQAETNWRSGWGEDYFLQLCLDKLGVHHIRDYAVLKDQNCLVPNPAPCTTGQAAFHPFKSSPGYWQCWNEAGGKHANKGLAPNPPGSHVLPPSDASGEDTTSTTEGATTKTTAPPTTTAEPTTTTVKLKPVTTAALGGPSVRASCANYGCQNVFRENQECQCNSACINHQSCCMDYGTACPAGGAAGLLPGAPAVPDVTGPGALDVAGPGALDMASPGTPDAAASTALVGSPEVGDLVQVVNNIETVQNALSRDNLKWSDRMLVMLGHTFKVVEAPKAGFVGLPSPNGSQGGVWYFPADVVQRVS